MSSSSHCETAKLKFGVNVTTPTAPNRHSTGANSAGCSFQQAASDRAAHSVNVPFPKVPFKDGLRLEVFTVRDSTSSLHDRTPDIIISVLRPVHSVHAEGLATFEFGTWHRARPAWIHEPPRSPSVNYLRIYLGHHIN
jgi:hypothetical protein